MHLGLLVTGMGKRPLRPGLPLFVDEEPETEFFLGDDLLPFLTLAIGAALLFGTAAAFIRPPSERAEGALERPPVGRSIVQMAIGLVATVWALATLMS